MITSRDLFLIASASVVLSISTVQATPFPGPDGFGYTGTSIGFNPRNISATGTEVLPNTDDTITGAIALPFNFTYYGNTYNSVFISSNGFVQFSDPDDGCCDGQELPTADSVNDVIAAFWMDWVTTGGTVRYGSIGLPGSLEFIIGWYNMGEFANDTNRATFEIILHEATNNIEMQFANASTSGDYFATTGIENVDGTQGLQYDNGSFGFAQSGLLFSSASTRDDIISFQVPEPASLALLWLGLAGLGLARRRKN